MHTEKPKSLPECQHPGAAVETNRKVRPHMREKKKEERETRERPRAGGDPKAKVA